MARMCIFCGGGPVTKEHVWSERILQRFKTTSVVAERTGTTPLRYTSRTIKLTISVVCRTCNNGWMSAIENAVMQVLIPMIGGEPTILDAERQLVLARWTTLKAMVFEHALSLPESEIYWSGGERSAFRNEPHVPPGEETVVRIAAYSGNRLAIGKAGATKMGTIAGENIGPPGTRATLAIGRAVLQIESHRWKDFTGRTGWWWPPKFGDRSEWIWPIQHSEVRWPTAAPLDDAALASFSHN